MDKARISLYVGDARPLYEQATFDRLYQAASEERKAKTDRLRLWKDKCLSLCAEALLSHACDEFGIPQKERTQVLGRYSKPSFSATDVEFNLSHSGTKALCVMSDLPVGCDIEQLRGYKARIAERRFTGSEQALLAACPDGKAREEMFYRIWTMKESFLKCTGRGLSLPMDSFSVIPEAPGRARVEQNADGNAYLIFEGALSFPGASEEDYRYAVCVQVPAEDAEIMPLSVSVVAEM